MIERLRALGIAGAFLSVTMLFFAWGFICSNNDPLIVALRAAFRLSYTEALLTQLVFEPGLSTVTEVSELAGRGIGLDVVRNEVLSLGGRIEVATEAGRGSRFTLLLPLTTAVTQVLLLRAGDFTFGVPAALVEQVHRVDAAIVRASGPVGELAPQGTALPLYWAGALLEQSVGSRESGKLAPVLQLRSATQRVLLHVDEVLGNQEVVVKHLGPQLSRLR